ncbi:MAG: alpha/beta fold hydrolase, partial [Waltera sp.]
MSKTYYDYAEVDWEQKYLDLDTGVRMAYYECGPKDGKTVLLIHGVTDGCVAWAQIAPVLEKAGCHCYIVEYRGNGMTDKPDMGPFGYTGELLADDIIDFIEKLDLQEIHVVGHSFGSLITQILAVKIPQRCADYVLIDTAVDCRNNPVILSVRNGDGDGFKGLDHYPDGLP